MTDVDLLCTVCLTDHRADVNTLTHNVLQRGFNNVTWVSFVRFRDVMHGLAKCWFQHMGASMYTPGYH